MRKKKIKKKPVQLFDPVTMGAVSGCSFYPLGPTQDELRDPEILRSLWDGEKKLREEQQSEYTTEKERLHTMIGNQRALIGHLIDALGLLK